MEIFWGSSHCHYYDASSDLTLWTPLWKHSLLRPLGGWEEREGARQPARGVGAGWRVGEGVELECQNG